jgi:hypothetical protein
MAMNTATITAATTTPMGSATIHTTMRTTTT